MSNDRYNAEEIIRGDTEYRPDTTGDAALPPAGGAMAADYGDGVQPGFDPRAEDRAAARSEETGSVSKREVDELVNDQTDAEKNVGGRYTRGAKVDAFQQERQVDSALEQSGIIGDDTADPSGRSRAGKVIRQQY